MCGIIGIIGKEDTAPRLVDSLKRLEYRGYDSSGIATVNDGKIERRRAEGKIIKLEERLKEDPASGNTGIGHTRWATHGAPVRKNAHPHATEKVAVVHNGIIENFSQLQKELEEEGHKFESDTDTEVIPQVITYYLNQGLLVEDAIKKAVARLEGAYALGIIFPNHEKSMVACRNGSPLAIGYGEGEMYLASDAIALANLTSEITYLEDGDIAFLTPTGLTIYDEHGNEASREITKSSVSGDQIGKENFNHYMQKEIYEQPTVISDALRAYYNASSGEISLPDLSFDPNNTSKITIVACGTSYYAGLVAKGWIEGVARISVDIDVASEFRYRNIIFDKKGVALFISQSGETADTLAAMRYAKENGQSTIAIVNAVESTMAREADVVLPIYSGPEIGVASTKAFTAQLVTLACFIISIAMEKGEITKEDGKKLTLAISELPSRLKEVLNHDEAIEELSHELAKAHDILYIGRGVSHAIALEGALKLKEISYIHAEAAAAGELKHGPIALVDEHVPIIAIAPSDNLFDKTASNIREVAARGGKIILLSDEKGIHELEDVTHTSIKLPQFKSADIASFVSPILYAIPVQLLAYHVAVIKGTDVDQPRNLAKSVTVE